jgi:hypothetical protein
LTRNIRIITKPNVGGVIRTQTKAELMHVGINPCAVDDRDERIETQIMQGGFKGEVVQDLESDRGLRKRADWRGGMRSCPQTIQTARLNT